MKIENQGSYLGEEIGISVSESVTLTLDKRFPLVKRSIFEIKQIINDCRSKVVGGIKTGLLLWNSCVIPYLYNNASTWMEISKKDLDRLLRMENLFLNNLLNVYKCPVPLMYWDLKILVPQLRILKEKLLLMHHISSLPPSALSHQVLSIQEKFNFPSILQEVKPFLNKHQIINLHEYSKEEWKRLISNRIDQDNRNFLINWSKTYKKIDTLSLECEDYEFKEYFSNLTLEYSRVKFRERSGCLRTCRTACPSDMGNIKANYKCFHCPELDTGAIHWRSCKFY